MSPRGFDELKDYVVRTGPQAGRVKLADLVALSEDNDPFSQGRPAHHELGKWFADRWARFGGPGAHLRRVHYRMLDQGILLPDGTPYVNDKRCWKRLTQGGTHARHLGYVDPTDFVDRRNDPVRTYGEPTRAWRPTPTWTVELGDRWRAPSIWLYWLPRLDPRIEVEGYEYAETDDQPVTVEVWIEKAGVDDVLDPLCRRLHANLMVGIGYESITHILTLLRERAKRPVRILYISDHDDAGKNMPVSVSRHIEYYLDEYAPDADLKVCPIVLTAEQVSEYQLPHAPDSSKVELDALESNHPGVLAELVRHAVVEWRDRELGAAFGAAREEAHDTVKQEWSDHVAQIPDFDHRLAQLRRHAVEIQDRFEARVDELNAELAEAYAPVVAEYEELRSALEEIELDVDLPDRPEGEVPDVDTDDWLFDSSREYFEQLDFYKFHKNGTK